MAHNLNHLQIRFVEKNYRHTSRKQMAQTLGVYVKRINDLMKEMGWSISREESRKLTGKSNSKKTTATPDQDAFILANYLTIPVKTMARMIGRSDQLVNTRMRQLGLTVPPEIIAQRKKDSRIKKGNTPPNKGKKLHEFMDPETVKKFKANQYKKGNLPHNTAERDGEIRIKVDHKDRNGRSYKWIRISIGNWVQLHRHEWEKVNGPIKKGMKLRCKGTDTLNCDPSNWELIGNRENMNRNSGSKNLSDGYVAGRMTHGQPELRKVILEEHPELIQLKRDQLLLNRKIKNHGQKQNSK